MVVIYYPYYKRLLWPLKPFSSVMVHCRFLRRDPFNNENFGHFFLIQVQMFFNFLSWKYLLLSEIILNEDSLVTLWSCDVHTWLGHLLVNKQLIMIRIFSIAYLACKLVVIFYDPIHLSPTDIYNRRSVFMCILQLHQVSSNSDEKQKSFI